MQSSTIPHPRWCDEDLPAGPAAVVHLSASGDIPATAGGPAEAGRISVSIERVDEGGCAGSPAVRIEGCDPMTPLQAFELATTLQAVALAALGVTR